MTSAADRDIADLAASYGLSFAGDDDLASFVEAVRGSVEGAESIADLPDEPVEVKYPRSEWAYPDPAENELGAWYVRTDIEGASSGKLSGRTVAIKDNIFVADVPMMDGTHILEGYVPPVDATVVTRLLDAGATIAGKSVCEAYCFSAGSHISESGPVLNPLNHERSAGGSSSGSAALVAAGEVDLAMGGDQGGSIRIPSSYCGIYGLKPTHGLVPYTGILGMDPSIDHTGPMTGSVGDNALMLEVIAGPDGLDERQPDQEAQAYTEALGGGVTGLKIGVLTEGFGYDDSDPDVDAKVRAAAERFAKLGAQVGDISVSMHRDAAIISAAFIPAIIDIMYTNDGLPLGRNEPLVESFYEVQNTWRQRPNDLPEGVKVFLIAAALLKRESGMRYVAKAINQTRRLKARYDAALQEVDLLLLPTTPMKASVLPGPDASREEIMTRSYESLTNTWQFNLTHHPALSLPCGLSDGLPVGLMLVGRHFDETTIYRAAAAFEQHDDWRTL